MLPWISMEASPQGTARVCCLQTEEITDENGQNYSLKKVPLGDIFNSKYMQDFRQDMRDGKKPESCKQCWAEEDIGRQSKRMSTYVRLPHIVPDIKWESNTSDTLQFIDLKLGNICNLKCRICGSWSSSKWAAEELDYQKWLPKKEHRAYTQLKAGQWPRESQAFWDNLRDMLPSIKYFEFTGGEPFLIQEHFDLLEFAADNGHADHIEIHYNTNGTVFPEHAIELWKKFKTVEVAFSIDDLGQRFEYQRSGAQWSEVAVNVQKFNALRDIMPNLITQVCLTVNVMNIYYLEQLCNWVALQEFDFDYFNMLHGPDHMCIKYMPVAAKDIVANKLRAGVFSGKHQSNITQIIDFMYDGVSHDTLDFITKTKQTDDFRRESLIDHHPEVAAFMGYAPVDTFCVLPWIHLASHPAGYATLCCEADHTGLRSASFDVTDASIPDGQPSFYNLKKDGINAVMNGQSFKQARVDMLAGKPVAACSTCYKKEAVGVISKRQREAKNFPKFTIVEARNLMHTDGNLPKPPLKFVELRLGNICNTRCVTCNPLSSSQWRSDYLALSKKFTFIQDKYQMMDQGRFKTWPTGFADANNFELDWPNNPAFWDELFGMARQLEVIYINGGEPTLIKLHWEFLDKLIKADLAKNIELHYSINMTNLPDHAIPTWKQFKQVRISCSIDDTPERNTYIRYPTSADKVAVNLAKLREHPELAVSICQTISAYNYFYLDEFYKFYKDIHIHYNFVTDPAYMSPLVLPQQLRDTIHHRLALTLPEHLMSQCTAQFNGPQDLDNYIKFKAVTDELDLIRGTNFSTVFSELSKQL
jgi:MoaA/NifB/PqqE/SkfB family radical SAM enzyme